MKFSSKKYNFIVAFMLVLISLVFLISTYFVEIPASADDNPDLDIQKPVEIPLPDAGEEELPPAQSVPTFNDGISAVMYGLDILNNSKQPYQYEFYNNTISAGLVNVNAYEKLYRHKNHDLMMVWTNTEIKNLPINPESGNFFRFSYANGDSRYNRYVYDTNNYDLEKRTYTLSDSDKISTKGQPIKDYYITDKTDIWGDFYLTINRNTAKVIYFEKQKDYYVVKLSVLTDKVKDDEYVQAYERNAMVDHVEFDYINLTFTISKKTGRIAKIVREDKYNLVTNVLGGLSLPCSSNATHLYTYMETEDIIKEKAKELGFNFD